jgi:hypothetical protein
MEETTRIILAYEKEMRDWKEEVTDTFGSDDDYVQRVTAQWLAVQEILIRLNLKPL